MLGLLAVSCSARACACGVRARPHACRAAVALRPPSRARTCAAQDLESYSYYLSALVEKKRLLSSFGGDSVRGISAKQRIENTSSRVGPLPHLRPHTRLLAPSLGNS